MGIQHAEMELTDLLHAWRGGDGEVAEELLPLVYGELRRMAARYLRGERAGHTLDPTALVNEAYLRIADRPVDWRDRVHFFATTATLMRRILVDHARARGREKRGGGLVRVTFDDARGPAEDRAVELIELDQALDHLAQIDPRKAKVVELHFFAGLSVAESAEALGCSPATVTRDWRLARAWLLRELSPDAP